jgi:tetratricopeptide (TPR) repeat protein
MIVKKLLLFLVVLFTHYTNAQGNYANIPDTLSSKSFYYLSQASLKNIDNSEKSQLYSKAWLIKAKSEKNYKQLALAYKSHIHNSSKEVLLLYADSMLMAAKKSTDIELIGSSYMTKGIVYYDRKEQMKALDNYLLADKYIARTNNQYLIYKLKYGMAQTKSYLGFYDEAISLLRECIDYFKEENDRAYLNSLHSLGLCYNRIGNYAWCTVTNQMEFLPLSRLIN